MSSNNTKYPAVLSVIVREARNLYNTQHFGKQDPYVTVQINKGKHKTQVCNNTGESGKWNETLYFHIDRPGETCCVEVRNKNPLFDDLIGRTVLYVDEALKHPDGLWVSIGRGNKQAKPAGELFLLFIAESKTLFDPNKVKPEDIVDINRNDDGSVPMAVLQALPPSLSQPFEDIKQEEKKPIITPPKVVNHVALPPMPNENKPIQVSSLPVTPVPIVVAPAPLSNDTPKVVSQPVPQHTLPQPEPQLPQVVPAIVPVVAPVVAPTAAIIQPQTPVVDLNGNWRVYTKDHLGRERSYSLELHHNLQDQTLSGQGQAANLHFTMSGKLNDNNEVHFLENWSGTSIDEVRAKVTHYGRKFKVRHQDGTVTKAKKIDDTWNENTHPHYYTSYYNLTGSWRIYFERWVGRDKKKLEAASYSLEIFQDRHGQLTGGGVAGKQAYRIKGQIVGHTVKYTEYWPGGEEDKDEVEATMEEDGTYFVCKPKRADKQEARLLIAMSEAERFRYQLPYNY